MNTNRLRNSLLTGLMAVIVFCVTACGTILYPERKGQISGKIDPMVVIMDGIGLLLFFVPGVIAFAVDFSNGTIYLPKDGASTLDTHGDLRGMETVKVGRDNLTKSNIELLIEQRTGKHVDLNSPDVKVVRANPEEM